MRYLFDEYYCEKDACDKPLIDGIPPCAECDCIVSAEELARREQSEKPIQIHIKIKNRWLFRFFNK